MIVPRHCKYIFLVYLCLLNLAFCGKFYRRHKIPRYYPRLIRTHRNPTNYYHQHVNNQPSPSYTNNNNNGCVTNTLCGVDQIYWKEKQKCVTLQEQGPCPFHHVVQKQSSGKLH